MNQDRKTHRGFSLIELMVAIAIIAVISSVALSSFSAIQRQGRDTQRQSDLRALQLALQQYYANESHFPDALTLTSGAALTNCTGIVSGCTVTRIYLGVTPADPVTGTGTPYCYTSLTSALVGATACVTGQASESTCHYYALHAKLENPPTGSGSFTCNSLNYDLRVTPL